MAITQLTTDGISKTPDVSGERIVWIEGNKVILSDGSTTTVLPDLEVNSKTNPQISADGIMWNGYVSGWQEFYYNNVETTQLTDEPYVYDEQLSGDRIAWRSAPEFSSIGNLYEVYVYDESTQATTQITDNDSREQSVDIDGQNIVWQGTGNTIFLHDGTNTIELTSNGVSPQVSGNNVVWEAYSGGSKKEIYLYDGSTTTKIVNNDSKISLQGFFDGNVIWSQWDGNDWELFRFDGTNTSQITNNNFNDIFNPSSTGSSASRNSSAAMDGSGDNLVWSSYVDNSWEVFFYDGTETIQITDNDVDDLNPKISGDTVVWSTKGATSDVFKFEPDPDPTTFKDDFNPDVYGSQWQQVSNGMANNNFAGDNRSLYFSGGNKGDDSRFAVSKALDLSAGGVISFDLIFGDSSNGGENADAREDVVLEYSTNNGQSWTELELYDTEDYTTWLTLAEPIPAEAQTNATILRWRQISHSGSSFDNWGLDNVELTDESVNFAPYGIDASFTVAENSSNSTVIGMVVADDPNPDQNLTYNILSGNDTGAFAIASNGELTVADGTALNYETSSSFNLEIEVADDATPSLSDTVAIEIDLIDIYEGTVLDSIIDDFNPDIDSSQWSSVGNSLINDDFGGDGNSLYFTGGDNQDDSRYLTTNGVNLANGGRISFDLIFGDNTNGGENVDFGEDVLLEYSVDGGNSWSEINLYDSEDYTSWANINESIPTGAQTNNTLFKWSQVQHGGSIFDNWGLDNIAIESN